MVALAFAVAFALGPPAELEGVAAVLRSAPAWEVLFTQRYVPSGLTRGTEESGKLLLRPPFGARFEYSGRVFALFNTVARLVDREAGTCQAVRLAPDALERLPLTAVLDPAAARASFAVEATPHTLTLTPRQGGSTVAKIVLTLGPDQLPSQIVVHDSNGDRNEFRFHRWQRRNSLSDSVFLPALPGLPPCQPEDG